MSEPSTKKALWQLIKLDSVDSTNDEAFRLYAEKGNDCLPNLIVAKTQTAGKGQFERKWESPEGNLYCSFSLSKSFVEWKLGQRIEEAQLTLKIGELLKETINLPKLKIKKPNDILYDSKKLAGILVEVKADLLVIGIGLNIKTAPIEESISLSEISKENFSIEEILKNIQDRLTIFLKSSES